MSELENKAIELLREVVDPEINMNVIDGKMIVDLKVDNKDISLKFRPTSPLCPIAVKLANDIKEKLIKSKLFNNINIEVIDHIMAKKINEMLK